MRIEDTPTFNKVGVHFSDVVRDVQREMHGASDNLFTFDQMRRMLQIFPSMLDGQDEADAVRNKFTAGISVIEAVANEFPELNEELSAGTQTLIMGMFELIAELINKKMENEVARMAALMEINAQKEAVISKACTIAGEKWESDHDQRIRVTEMAHIVYAELHAQGLSDQLPRNPLVVKDWIKAGAPKHARQGGKPKKSI